MQFRSIALLTVATLAVNACQQSALLQMKNENAQSEVRIQQKEQRLSELENQNISLQAQKLELQKELETTKMNLDQLSEKLRKLKLKNDKIRAATPEQLKKKELFSSRLQQFRDQIKALKNSAESSQDNQLSKTAKEKRIKELREEIKVYLQFGLD